MSIGAGQIVLVDWRDALPKEPNQRRPAIVVENRGLFDDTYPTLILVSVAEEAHLASADLAVAIAPTADHGCTKPCYVLAHHVTTTSKQRITPTPSHITAVQRADIRRLIGISLGIE